jgi:hypothetical protein
MPLTGGCDEPTVWLQNPDMRALSRGALRGIAPAEARQPGKNAGYTIRQGAYDLRKLRGKGLAVKPGTTRRYHTPAEAARTTAALLALRDQAIAPILAGVRSPRRGRKPAHWTTIDRDYETLRIGMQDSSTTSASRRSQLPPHRQQFVDR